MASCGSRIDGGGGPDGGTAEDVVVPPPLPTVGPLGWQRTFWDEFNGTALDRTKWATKFKWGGSSLPQNGERECYVDQNVSLSGGRLLLKAERRTMTCDGRTNPFASGMVSAHPSMAQLYGYFEMRAKMPRGKALWPAFWSLPNQKTTLAEIDVVELLGHEPTKLYMNVHWETSGVRQSLSTAYSFPGWDFSTGYHTYAVDWRPGSITWYVDGNPRKVFRASDAPGSYVPYESMYLIANLAVGGAWPGEPDATTPAVSYLEIDHIRALEQVNAGGANPNLLVNPGFESGTTSWRFYGGATISTLARSGTRAARLEGQAGFERVVTNLKPFTVYRMTGWLRSLTGSKTMIGVKNYGGHQYQNVTVARSYEQRTVTFMTGNTTSALVFGYQADGSSVIDDLQLTVAP
ncbi:MAG TPA: family 16 glycosylhydrolase [Kofleriaceae bacterium]